MISLLYVSHGRIDPETAETVIGEIVAASVANNLRRHITGVLLFTGTHFAQVLEGAENDVDAVFGSICRDERHDRLIVVDRTAIPHRCFESWSMGYSGPSQFVARHVTRLLDDPSPFEKHRALDWLKDLMQEFAEP